MKIKVTHCLSESIPTYNAPLNKGGRVLSGTRRFIYLKSKSVIGGADFAPIIAWHELTILAIEANEGRQEQYRQKLVSAKMWLLRIQKNSEKSVDRIRREPRPTRAMRRCFVQSRWVHV